jgi:hypothetical protein
MKPPPDPETKLYDRRHSLSVTGFKMKGSFEILPEGLSLFSLDINGFATFFVR